MSTSNEESGPVAALMIPRINKYLITFAWAVHDHIENNPALPNPNPMLQLFADDIEAFQDMASLAPARPGASASG